MIRVPPILKPWNYEFQPYPPPAPGDPSPGTVAAFIWFSTCFTLMGLALNVRLAWLGMIMMTLIGAATGCLLQPLLLKKTTPTLKMRIASGAMAGLLLGLATFFAGQENYKAGTSTFCLSLVAMAICAVYTFTGRTPAVFIPLQAVAQHPQHINILQPQQAAPSA